MVPFVRSLAALLALTTVVNAAETAGGSVMATTFGVAPTVEVEVEVEVELEPGLTIDSGPGTRGTLCCSSPSSSSSSESDSNVAVFSDSLSPWPSVAKDSPAAPPAVFWEGRREIVIVTLGRLDPALSPMAFGAEAMEVMGATFVDALLDTPVPSPKLALVGVRGARLPMPMDGRRFPLLSLDIEVIANPAIIPADPDPEPDLCIDGRRETAGESAEAATGVGGPSWPWSSMCSRVASSRLSNLFQRCIPFGYEVHW